MANNDPSPQSTGASPPPPPGGLAPPPPPPRAAYPPVPQPAAQWKPPSSTPPKKRNGWVIALIVGLLSLCALGACITTFVIAGGSAEKGKVTQAEAHYAVAESQVGSAESAVESATAAGSADQMTVSITVATKSLRSARDEIAAAKTSAERLKESPGKTDYLASLAAATAALDGLENLIGYLDTASGMVSRANQAGEITKQANSDLDDAIGLGNKGAYAQMRVKAKAASSGYAKAATLFEDADKLDPTAELAKAATYARKREQQADIVVRMADEGKAKRYSAYNSDIKKQKALGEEALAAGLPAILSDPNWAQTRLAALGKSIMLDAEKADTLRRKALEELGYTK